MSKRCVLDRVKRCAQTRGQNCCDHEGGRPLLVEIVVEVVMETMKPRELEDVCGPFESILSTPLRHHNMNLHVVAIKVQPVAGGSHAWVPAPIRIAM